ncbi:MAG: metallophosphoesterase [Candidatus Thermoplasmatota archaeon]|jgi:hypothetical protein|nr:metallophosphoesterase [Candidatus Thermoplasmatota archaeon]
MTENGDGPKTAPLDNGGGRRAPTGFQLLVFSTIVTTITLIAFLYVGVIASLVMSPDNSLHWPYLAVPVLLTLFMMVSQIASHIDHRAYIRPLYLMSSVLMGAFAYMVMAAFMVTPILIPAYLLDIDSIWTSLRIMFAAVILVPVVWGLIEARILRTRWFKVPLPGLKKAVKVAMISDVHLGLLVGRMRLGKVLSIMEGFRPDVIAVVGDLYDTNPRFNTRFRPMLERMASMAPAYAVFGNHEYFNGHEAIGKELSELGFNVLRGRAVKDPKTGINVVGIDDPSFFGSGEVRREQLLSLLREVPEGEPLILLDHQPLLFSAAKGARPLLQLSGHTHAGQIWPASFITKRIYKDGHRGLSREGASTLFVCVGTGTWGPPMRVLAPPEMALFELVPA